MLNVGLLDIASKVSRKQVELALSEIAEVCIEAAFDQAKHGLAGSSDEVPHSAIRGEYLIVGICRAPAEIS